MAKHKVLIMGRPNVGKSTLINRMTQSRQAITADQPGVTRDIGYFDIHWQDKSFTLVDSGGIFLSKTSDIYLQGDIEDKVKAEVNSAAIILFIVDYQTGIHSHDQKIAQFLRKSNKPVWVLVNKADDMRKHTDTQEFYQLGFGDPKAISAAHGQGIEDILTDLVNALSIQDDPDESVEPYKIALVGRPNVGKSSLLNAILNEDRVIVDNQAGTTRDSVTVRFKYNQQPYTITDTAGLRKKTKVNDSIEFYSSVRSAEAIKSADVTVMVLDAADFLTDQDKRIINSVIENAKSMIIFVNKWDLTNRTDSDRREITKKAKKEVSYLEHYPFVFGSAMLKHNVHRLFDWVPELVENSLKRVKTGQLNQFVEQVILRQPPPSKQGKLLKILYATQAESNPPMFIFFVNKANLMTPSYERFLEKRIREHFGFFGSPIKAFFKNRTTNQT